MATALPRPVGRRGVGSASGTPTRKRSMIARWAEKSCNPPEQPNGRVGGAAVGQASLLVYFFISLAISPTRASAILAMLNGSQKLEWLTVVTVDNAPAA